MCQLGMKFDCFNECIMSKLLSQSQNNYANRSYFFPQNLSYKGVLKNLSILILYEWINNVHERDANVFFYIFLFGLINQFNKGQFYFIINKIELLVMNYFSDINKTSSRSRIHQFKRQSIISKILSESKMQSAKQKKPEEHQQVVARIRYQQQVERKHFNDEKLIIQRQLDNEYSNRNVDHNTRFLRKFQKNGSKSSNHKQLSKIYLQPVSHSSSHTKIKKSKCIKTQRQQKYRIAIPKKASYRKNKSQQALPGAQTVLPRIVEVNSRLSSYQPIQIEERFYEQVRYLQQAKKNNSYIN